MRSSNWPRALANTVLGREAELRRHVLLMSSSIVSYGVSVAVLLHALHMGILAADVCYALVGVSIVMFLTFWTLVRSGWTQRFKDPILAFPHSLMSITICAMAYAALGDHRADSTILIAQTIVLSMLRLRPRQMLVLGLYAATLLLIGALGLTWWNPTRFPMRSAMVHFVVAGSALLSLSLVAKWVTEIRVKISRQAKQLQAAIVRVEEMATHDMLTGALNRRIGTELAEAELRQVERQGAQFCVALLDLDHFKQINDGCGHQVGDAVLAALADHARSQLRQVDKVARWGGEEFLILLPSVTLDQALVAMDRVRDSFAALRLPQHPDVRATFSVGLAQARHGDTLEHLLERADHALYEAKRQGRNRCMAEAPMRDGAAGVSARRELTS